MKYPSGEYGLYVFVWISLVKGAGVGNLVVVETSRVRDSQIRWLDSNFPATPKSCLVLTVIADTSTEVKYVWTVGKYFF